MEKSYSKTTSAAVQDEDETGCGIGSCKPKPLQRCANVQAFVGFYSLISLVTQMLVSYLGSQIPSIEKQFGLSSSYSGLLMSFNDIGYLSLCLIVTTLTKYVHIPRWLFGCFIIYGVSGMLCGIPHFISVGSGKLPSFSNNLLTKSNTTSFNNGPLCTGNTSDTKDCESNFISSTGSMTPAIRQLCLALFGTGMILQGAAKSIRGPFVTVYVDDGGDRKKTGYYMGIIIAITIVGPVLSYVFGGVFSKLYVTLEDVDFGPNDPRWIGAWWLGFILFGACAVVLAIPLAFFPRHLKQQAREDADMSMKTPAIVKGLYVRSTAKVIYGREKLRKKEKPDRLLSFWRVLKNPVYSSHLCAEIISYGSFAATFAFLSKYIYTQFSIPLWEANMILAVANISSFAIGTFVGGFITKRINPTPRRVFALISLFHAVYILLFALGLILGCNQPPTFGPESIEDVQLEAKYDCFSHCSCDKDQYFPVCGSDGITYHSPCYAGCENTAQTGMGFMNCTCIPDGIAKNGVCKTDCNTLWPYAVSRFLAGFVAALMISPGFIAKIRCVDDKDKSTAIGLSAFFSSLFGLLPTPIIIGKVIDSTCRIWQTTCSSTGACLFYDIVDFRVKLHVVAIGLKTLALMFYLLAFYKVRKMADWPSSSITKEYEVDNTVSGKEVKMLINDNINAKQND